MYNDFNNENINGSGNGPDMNGSGGYGSAGEPTANNSSGQGGGGYTDTGSASGSTGSAENVNTAGTYAGGSTGQENTGAYGSANGAQGNTGSFGYNGADASFNSNGQYRMKFNSGAQAEHTGTYGAAHQSRFEQNYMGQGPQPHANEYSYYHQSGPVPGNQGKKRSPKKKGSTGRQLAKVVCFGLVFGLVAGGTMVGVNALGNWSYGSSKSSATANPEGTSSGSDEGFTLDVVKVSSKDVQTFEATDVSDIVAEAKASLVSVSTVVETTSRDIFGRTYSQEGSGAGSGIIFSERDNTLYLVTNYHVIENSKQISVAFNDGSTAEATIKGYDEDGDIAVLTVDMNQLSDETKSAIRIAVLGDSDELKEGSGAIAIGNALGYGQSTTTGTISAVNREVQLTDGTMILIQTDAAINPGNSGGALLNARGEVIGINTVKFSDTSVEGMGYAIPINTVVETVNDIISGKIVNKTEENTAVLGIRGGTVDEATSEAYGWPKGVYVSAVIQNSAAQRAGLQSGYVIVGFNGEEVTTMDQLQELLSNCNPGDTVTLEVRVPDANGEYSSETQSLKTLLGSAADISQY